MIPPTETSPSRGEPSFEPTHATNHHAGRLARVDALDLLDQLRALTRAGVPLPSGLRAARLELESAGLRDLFGRLADRLDAGAGLDAALQAEANRFPAQVRGLVVAAGRAGGAGLPDTLGQLVRSGDLGRELRHRVAVAVAYPATVALIMLILVGFVCRVATTLTNDLPNGRSFRFTFGPALAPFWKEVARLAGPDAILAITRFVADYDLIAAVALGGLAAMGVAVFRFGLTPVQARRVTLAVPLVGPLARFAALAEFCYLGALLVEGEAPLPEALNLAGASVADPVLAESCGRVAEQVAAGEPFAASLQAWADLPPALGQILAQGEAQSDLAGALRFAGAMFEARAAAQAGFAGQVLAGLLFVLLFLLAAFSIAAVYIPIRVVWQIIWS